MYSVAIFPTDGRYGSVTTSVSHWSPLQCGLIFPTRQIYSLTRIAGLMSVIFHMIDLDLVTPINCQVGAMLHLYQFVGLTTTISRLRSRS
jgi:hypothetical protein